MKPAPFEYHAPTTVDEATSLLARYGDDAKLLAGGQSLVPLLALRLAQPSVLIDLNGVRELDYIRNDVGTVSIGSMTRHRSLERSEMLRTRCPLIPAAVAWIGHQQIRNRGTIGGSLAHADPAAELPAVASVLDAAFTVTSANGTRRMVPVSDFFLDTLTTALGPDELLTEVTFPALPQDSSWAFTEVARRHGDFALVGVAATIAVDGSGICTDAHIALFGVGATPIRPRSAEQALLHQQIGEVSIALASAQVAHDIDPGDDIHASAAYRSYVATNLVQSTLTEAAQRAQSRISSPKEADC